MTLEVQKKSFIRLLSVDTGFQAVVYYGDLHAISSVRAENDVINTLTSEDMENMPLESRM